MKGQYIAILNRGVYGIDLVRKDPGMSVEDPGRYFSAEDCLGHGAKLADRDGALGQIVLLNRGFVRRPAAGVIIEGTFASQLRMENTEKIMPEEAQPETPAQSETEAVQAPSELETLKGELDEWKDKHLRLVAEFENFKRRNARERVELMQTAGKEVIQALLDVLDDCDRAQKQLEGAETDPALKEGILLVFNKLRSTLQQRGLKTMETIQTEFNADLHEAITEIPAPSEDLKGKVLDEVMKGYYLNDKIIRHAKVVVGN